MSMTLGRTLWVWCWAATTSGPSIFQQFVAENSLHRVLFCFHRHMLCRHQLIIDRLWKHGECDSVYFQSCSTHWVCVYIYWVCDGEQVICCLSGWLTSVWWFHVKKSSERPWHTKQVWLNDGRESAFSKSNKPLSRPYRLHVSWSLNGAKLGTLFV